SANLVSADIGGGFPSFSTADPPKPRRVGTEQGLHGSVQSRRNLLVPLTYLMRDLSQTGSSPHRVPDEGMMAQSPDKRPSRNGDKGSNDSGSGGGSGNGKQGPGNLRPSRGLFGLVTVLMCSLMLFLIISNVQNTAAPINTWQDFETLYRNGDMTEVE